MRIYILVVAVVAVVACKKDKAEQQPASAPAPAPAEAKAPTPTAAAVAGARPPTVTDAQSAAYEKFTVEAEALGRDVAAAGDDCAKLATATTSHAAALTAAQDAMLAVKIDDADVTAKAWLAASYGTRLATALAGYGMSAAKCATDKAFVAASAGLKLGGDAMDQAGVAVDEAGDAMDQAGKAMDQAGMRLEEAGKRLDEAGKRIDKARGKAGKADDE
jgi:hypothetical protein